MPTQPKNKDPLPEFWECKHDPKSGRDFYINHQTKTTQWARPVAGPPWTCVMCTTENPGGLSRCHVCNSPKTKKVHLPKLDDDPLGVPEQERSSAESGVQSFSGRSSDDIAVVAGKAAFHVDLDDNEMAEIIEESAKKFKTKDFEEFKSTGIKFADPDSDKDHMDSDDSGIGDDLVPPAYFDAGSSAEAESGDLGDSGRNSGRLSKRLSQQEEDILADMDDDLLIAALLQGDSDGGGSSADSSGTIDDAELAEALEECCAGLSDEQRERIEAFKSLLIQRHEADMRAVKESHQKKVKKLKKHRNDALNQMRRITDRKMSKMNQETEEVKAQLLAKHKIQVKQLEKAVSNGFREYTRATENLAKARMVAKHLEKQYVQIQRAYNQLAAQSGAKQIKVSRPGRRQRPVEKKPPKNWNCPMCTYENGGMDEKCLMCETPKPV